MEDPYKMPSASGIYEFASEVKKSSISARSSGSTASTSAGTSQAALSPEQRRRVPSAYDWPVTR